MTEDSARRRASMGDVARHAGVSPQTVSRVSNGLSTVAPDTRRVVLESMHALGYRPNGAARALKSGSFRTLGVAMFDLTETGTVRTVDAIVRSAAAAGYAVTLIPIDVPTSLELDGVFTRLGELAVDGIIVLLELHLLDTVRLALPLTPRVFANSGAGALGPIVDTDQAQGATLAVEHLLDLGHHTVWHIAGPAESFAAERRAEAWERVLRSRSRAVPPALVGDWTSESGYRLGRELAADPAVSAVFAASDEMALGLYRAFAEAGRRIPEDVSIVGFDDVPGAASFHPPLTTVRQDFDGVGALCVARVLEQIEGSSRRDDLTLVPTRLVVRASTAPAR